MLKRINNLYQEIKLLGFKSGLLRLIFEVNRRSGLEEILRRPDKNVTLLSNLFKKNPSYINDFKESGTYVFIKDNNQIDLVKNFYKKSRVDSFVKKADKHINLEFEYFFKEWNKFNTINWYKYPSDSSKEWPKIHSSKILLNLEKFGDIKQIWEIGRFAWLYDFVRAWTLSQNDIYLKSALDLIKDFIKKNPIYIGPHWSSEQEVSIRAYALIFFLEATKNCEYLKDEDLLDIHNFLYIHGEYLNKNIHYAEISIRNNHLIHGAVGLYTISHFFNLHQSSAAWRKKSKKIILDCLNEQWYEDGGYIQPSHIYHRSALHGLLIARKVSYIQNDSIMVKSIDKILDKDFNFLINFISRTDGMLPNWGPNDGSLVFPVTCCDYVDFRPILQTISTLIYKERSFNLIDVNEESIWLYGEDPDKFKIKIINKRNKLALMNKAFM